jgi:hypothetical protein
VFIAGLLKRKWEISEMKWREQQTKKNRRAEGAGGLIEIRCNAYSIASRPPGAENQKVKAKLRCVSM